MIQYLQNNSDIGENKCCTWLPLFNDLVTLICSTISNILSTASHKPITKMGTSPQS